jgi:hypothetical protein
VRAAGTDADSHDHDGEAGAVDDLVDHDLVDHDHVDDHHHDDHVAAGAGEQPVARRDRHGRWP